MTKDYKIIASDGYGVNIYDIVYGCNDSVIISNNSPKKSRSMIRYDVNGRMYFMSNRRKYYIDEMMRTDYNNIIK